MLPNIQTIQEPETCFPTKWQTVIFRNYGFISTEKLAKTLRCDKATVETEARRLGLPVAERARWETWEKRGYITIIRNNWYLLPYEQLLELLGIDAQRLDFILTNDDFLSVKLGGFKPRCDAIYYAPLTEKQASQTLAIAEDAERLLSGEELKPFDFFPVSEQPKRAISGDGQRIVHGYLSPCGDAFMEDDEEYLPDRLLEAYRDDGVNGLWFHGLLSALSPYPFAPSASKGHETRRKNLQRVVDRCAKYGIRVYLYLNEPRGLPKDKIGKYAHLIGRTEGNTVALCWAREETKAYLYNAIKDLLQNVHGLGGFITITMSENLTHCNYRPYTNCRVCKNIPPEQSAAEVNNVIARAARDSGSGAEVIANLWGWSPFLEWTEEQTMHGVELLDKDVSVMCVSEYDLAISKGGVDGCVIDYSISNVGPSEITKRTLRKAGQEGHKLYAKIQVNNSWECSAVPCLPVFDLIYRHLRNLSAIGVKDYMLTWTLGGCPSEAMALVAEYAEKGDRFDLSAWYAATYGEYAKSIRRAVTYFCEGFQEYPFSLDSLYNSPKTLGEANLYALGKQNLRSTMVCYAFDDYQTWTNPYPVEIYLSQYEKLLLAWEKGLRLLPKDEERSLSDAIRNLRFYAECAYLHFYSDYLQTKFSVLKSDLRNNALEIESILCKSLENVERLIALVHRDAKIGFEASNHYFYTDRNLAEKVINVKGLLRAVRNEL